MKLPKLPAVATSNPKLSRTSSRKQFTNERGAKSQLEELRHAFAQFDANGDGKISAEELCALMRSLGDVRTTPQEAVLMVADVDADGDGFIDLQEFIDLNMNRSYVEFVQQQEELAAAFAMFDLDRNGRISPEELHTVLINLGNRTSTLDECRRMIRGVDRKGSGHVDFDDFKTMMTA